MILFHSKKTKLAYDWTKKKSINATPATSSSKNVIGTAIYEQ
ncbi:MAG: hypothetical protein WC223_08620 [Bacteroidales bacterium]